MTQDYRRPPEGELEIVVSKDCMVFYPAGVTFGQAFDRGKTITAAETVNLGDWQ